MSKIISRIFVLILLALTSALQGWPLLVAATCNMPEPQTMSQMGACCCCDKSQSLESPAFSSCTPGKTLVGVLSTEPSLLPGTDTTQKMEKSSPSVQMIASGVLLSLHHESSLTPVFRTEHTVLLHTLSPPIFLIDRVFRI
jgi:hypothetical protein